MCRVSWPRRKKVMGNMNTSFQHLISKDRGSLQIPYSEYATLMEEINEGKRLREIKNEVVASLERVLDRSSGSDAVMSQMTAIGKGAVLTKQKTSEEKEAPIGTEAPGQEGQEKEILQDEKKAVGVSEQHKNKVEPPPIKKEIAKHFNAFDESGRLFDVFKQYYTFLNDACGGTVVVTMKDGVCSLWNYDEWEEFAFIDIFEKHLRFALDTRYTDDLSSLKNCEVPRLLASRRKLVSVQTDDLNKTMLSILAKAFAEVGKVAS